MTFSRRGVLGAGLATLGAAALPRGLSGFTDPLQMRDEGELPSSGEPVRVPSDFVGMHAHRWPQGEPLSPEPAYRFGAARSHDYDGAAWYRIHRAPGIFDWSRLDAWVTAHTQAGRTLLYTLYGTPAWAASRREWKDPYGESGGASPPMDPGAVTEFICALVNRYNSDGVRRIAMVEIWNEPKFVHDPTDFWWGTASELAALGRAVYLSAKAVDSGVRVLSPGFAGNLAGRLSLAEPDVNDARSSPMYQYLTASDGRGEQGRRWCDGIAFHCYNAPLSGANRGFVLEIRRMQAMLRLLHVSLPLYDTEFGFLADDPFHRLSLEAQATTLRRCAAWQAALGVRGLYFYAHDDALVGNPSLHPEVAEAIDDVHAMMAGKTLKQVMQRSNGTAEVTTTERTFLW